MSELDNLEGQLIHLLFMRARVLDELAAIAFNDITDYIIIQNITDEKGQQKQVMALHPDINEMDMRGVEIIQGEDSLTVRVPHRMKALEVLWRYFGEGKDNDNEADLLSSRIKAEQAKIQAILDNSN